MNNKDYGIYLFSSDSSNPGEIKNSIIWNNSNRGLYLNGVDNYNISNNNITNNTNYDIYLTSSTNNNFLWNNTFESNSSMFDAASDNEWNRTAPIGGNRWLFFDEPSEGCYDNDGDGFCDDANITIPGGGTGKDELPLYAGPLKITCGSTITTSRILNTNLTCNGTALYLAADNIKFECNDTFIKGNGTGIGIKISTKNVSVQNCKITNFAKGIEADPGSGLSINNTNFNNTANCTVLNAYNNSLIFDNEYFNCTQNAILLINDSNNNSIYNNNINYSGTGVNILSGQNNTVWNNTFTNSTTAHANSIANNNFNNSNYGNSWDDILALQIFDTDGDGLGDAGSEYPYNSTNNANVTGEVNDFKPFTTKTPGLFTVAIIKPEDNFLSNTTQINITCTANSSDNVNNITGIIWNSTGSVVSQNSTNPNTPNPTTSWMTTINKDGNYTAGCNATNILGQTNTSQNNSFTIDTTPPNIQFTNPTTTTGNHSQNWITANITATDALIGLKNITLNLYNSTFSLINTTNSTTSPLYTNFTNLQDGTYYINATAHDTLNNTNNTETRNITLDTTPPNIQLISPPNGTSTTQTTITFSYNLTDSTRTNCTLTIDGTNVTNQTNLTTGTYNFTQTLTTGTHLWNITCNDQAGNSNASNTLTLTITTPPTPTRGGTGGGGGSTYTPPSLIKTKPQKTVQEKPAQERPKQTITQPKQQKPKKEKPKQKKKPKETLKQTTKPTKQKTTTKTTAKKSHTKTIILTILILIITIILLTHPHKHPTPQTKTPKTIHEINQQLKKLKTKITQIQQPQKTQPEKKEKTKPQKTPTKKTENKELKQIKKDITKLMKQIKKI